MFPVNDRGALRDSVARAFVHGKMRTVAESYQGRDPATASHSAHLGPNLSQPLINVAEAIVNLRQARHEADYNRAQQFTRMDALDAHDVAKQAFSDWQVVRRRLHTDVFLGRLLAHKSMRM